MFLSDHSVGCFRESAPRPEVARSVCFFRCPQHPLTVGPPPVPKSGADYYQQVVAPQVLTVDRTLLTFAESESAWVSEGSTTDARIS